MSDITQLLHASGQGDPSAAQTVMSALYSDLQRLARRHLRGAGELTLLDTQGLVSEAWLRLAPGASQRRFADRGHFFAYAAHTMRSVVIDLVRARQAQRRGGDVRHQTLDTALAESLHEAEDEALRIHEALDELARLQPRLAQVVEMRYFAGLQEAEIATALGVTERTVQRDWHKARILLAQALRA